MKKRILATVMALVMGLAMVGCGKFASVQEASDALVEIADHVLPEPELTEKYEKAYRRWRKLYPALKNFFKE